MKTRKHCGSVQCAQTHRRTWHLSPASRLRLSTLFVCMLAARTALLCALLALGLALAGARALAQLPNDSQASPEYQQGSLEQQAAEA